MTENIEKSLPVISEEPTFESSWANSIISFEGFNKKCPKYWSVGRDKFLREIVAENDFIASAMYNAVVKLGSLPFEIVPKNNGVSSHVALAQRYNDLWESSWHDVKEPFLNDIQGQDNGGFLEIIDDIQNAAAPPDQARLTFGGLRHLDAGRCQRTKNPIYPVLYRHDDDKLYKLHHTRVLHITQMPSPARSLNGVGFCAVSRALQNVMILEDMNRVYEEYFGSKPRSEIIFANGISAEDMRNAFKRADEEAKNDGHMYARHVYLGVVGIDNADIKTVKLSGLPDNFNKETEITQAMYLIATAFGFDARELWPATDTGASKADALVQHMKARGKTPAWFAGTLIHRAKNLILPPALEMVSDFVDDDLDEQQARVVESHARASATNIKSEVLDVRSVRLGQMRKRHITRDEFERLELADGRLYDGNSVLSLFYARDTYLKSLLDLGVDDPLDYENNDAGTIVPEIDRLYREALQASVNASSDNQRRSAVLALAALEHLKEEYAAPMPPPATDPTMAGNEAPPTDQPPASDQPVSDQPPEVINDQSQQ